MILLFGVKIISQMLSNSLVENIRFVFLVFLPLICFGRLGSMNFDALAMMSCVGSLKTAVEGSFTEYIPTSLKLCLNWNASTFYIQCFEMPTSSYSTLLSAMTIGQSKTYPAIHAGCLPARHYSFFQEDSNDIFNSEVDTTRTVAFISTG